jgi:hypothetical protein
MTESVDFDKLLVNIDLANGLGLGRSFHPRSVQYRQGRKEQFMPSISRPSLEGGAGSRCHDVKLLILVSHLHKRRTGPNGKMRRTPSIVTPYWCVAIIMEHSSVPA